MIFTAITIPEFITVHLGAPDSAARNVRVAFSDYIKNVASSEIYPTWPENALRANILAETTFALNRVFTEWYRSRGYNFDITNNTYYDQKFIEGRDYFEPIVKIVDDIFNDYVVKQGSVSPYFTSYCNGTSVTCDGLSQWGTVDLAKRGLSPYEILQHYYGNNINIVFNAPVGENIESYPGIPLRLGSAGEDVRTIQIELNRIGDNYPSIPRLSSTSGFFNIQTEEAVKEFQRIFNLTPDGIVGKSTWYKIKQIYTGVKNLSELYSEGISLEEATRIYSEELSFGESGSQIGVLQYYLSVIGTYDPDLPPIAITNIFDEETRDAVFAFQAKYNLPVNGRVDRRTWNAIVDVYDSTLAVLPQSNISESEKLFPGRFLSLGITGTDVTLLQKYLKLISTRDTTIPKVDITGEYDSATAKAVSEIQRRQGISVNGVTGPLTWYYIIRLYNKYT